MVELKKVMIKDGISYIQMNSYGNVNPEYYLVNDEIPEVAKGQQNYFIYNGEVKSLKVRRTRKGKPTHYELYDKYKGVVQLPETLPIDHFTNEKDYDDEYIEENREFYKMVYAPDEVYFEDIPFEIIDRNSEPRSIPSFVHIDFPNNISKYKEVQHNYPCYITAKDMFDIIYDSILEKIKNYSDIYSWDNYKNIQTLRVSEKIKLTTPHSKVVNYYPSARSRKTKTKTVYDYHKTIKILEFYGVKYSNPPSGAVIIDSLRGENLDDLLNKLEQEKEKWLSKIDLKERCICDKCEGLGMIEI